jgi:hypothetical protein
MYQGENEGVIIASVAPSDYRVRIGGTGHVRAIAESNRSP